MAQQYTIESKDFIPPNHVDCLKNPIPAPDAFKEGNMANILLTIQVNIFSKTRVVENISIADFYSP